MEDKGEIIYKAAWANEIVYMCEKHMRQLITVGNAMGAEVKPTLNIGPEVCSNCKKEASK